MVGSGASGATLTLLVACGGDGDGNAGAPTLQSPPTVQRCPHDRRHGAHRPPHALRCQRAELVNTRLELTSTNLSGSAADVAFGPESGVALLEIDASGIAMVTGDGVHIANVDVVTVIGADNFRLTGTVLRSAY